MSKSAIIQISGKQYRVAVGDLLEVDKIEAKDGEKISITDVLLVKDENELKIGAPLVKDAVVTLVTKTQKKGDKVRVFKYKSKSRYRKSLNHRQRLTVFEVDAIS